VAAVRQDARVAVFRRGGRIVGFLAHHRRPGGLARPIGAPFSDYHALISKPDPGFTAAEALCAAQIRVFRFAGLIDPWRIFGANENVSQGYKIVLQSGPEAHLAAVRSRGPQQWKTWAKRQRRLERDHGAMTVNPDNNSQAALHRLFEWKSAQLSASGLHDVLRPSWVQKLMTGLHGKDARDLAGVLSTLEVAGEPIAGNFGVRSGERFHSWIIAYDPRFKSYSPGSLLQLENIRAMPQLGLGSWDIGGGDDAAKSLIAFETTRTAAGSASSDGRAPSGYRASLPAPISRIGRRFDHIAAAEPTLPGRISGVVSLLLGAKHRLSAKSGS
jgi:CelD/BcsL family acetyltransferase involved in cellulose biosynthesis